MEFRRRTGLEPAAFAVASGSVLGNIGGAVRTLGDDEDDDDEFSASFADGDGDGGVSASVDGEKNLSGAREMVDV